MSFQDTIINLFIFITLIGIIPLFFLEYQYRDPTEPFFPKISIVLIAIGFLIWYFSEEQKDNYNNNKGAYPYNNNINNNYNRNNNYSDSPNEENENEVDDYLGAPAYDDNIYYNKENVNYNNSYINFGNKTYCNKVDMNTYNKNKKDTTFMELNKLVQKKEFIDMASKKGEDFNNWNWQSREKMKLN